MHSCPCEPRSLAIVQHDGLSSVKGVGLGHGAETIAGTLHPKVDLQRDGDSERPMGWRGETGTYGALLSEVSVFSSFDPQPLFLFEFARGHGCEELRKIRKEIARSAKCAPDGFKCVQGTMSEFQSHT